MNLRWRCKVGSRRFVIKFVKIILVIFRAKERNGGKEVFNRGIQGSVGNVLIPGETLNPAIRRARVNRAAGLRLAIAEEMKGIRPFE